MGELDTVVVMHDREFDIRPPDGLIVIRLLQVIAEVGLRAQEKAAAFGIALFGALQAQAGEGGDEEEAGVVEVDRSRLLPAVFAFLSVLTEDDLLRLGAALLQFADERKGMRWLKENGVALSPLVRALVLTVQQANDLVEAIQSFTPMVSGMMVANQAVKEAG